MNNTLSLIAQIIVICGGLSGFAALLLSPAQRKRLVSQAGKTDAEADKVLTDAAVAMLTPAREQLDFLRSELRLARDQIAELRRDLEDANRELVLLRSAHPR